MGAPGKYLVACHRVAHSNPLMSFCHYFFRRKHYQRILYFRLQVVGSQARILYLDQRGRVALAQAFNKGITDGRLRVSTVFFPLKCTARQILYIALGRINYQLTSQQAITRVLVSIRGLVRFFAQLC